MSIVILEKVVSYIKSTKKVAHTSLNSKFTYFQTLLDAAEIQVHLRIPRPLRNLSNSIDNISIILKFYASNSAARNCRNFSKKHLWDFLPDKNQTLFHIKIIICFHTFSVTSYK